MTRMHVFYFWMNAVFLAGNVASLTSDLGLFGLGLALLALVPGVLVGKRYRGTPDFLGLTPPWGWIVVGAVVYLVVILTVWADDPVNRDVGSVFLRAAILSLLWQGPPRGWRRLLEKLQTASGFRFTRPVMGGDR